jgi:hypothetical protein
MRVKVFAVWRSFQKTSQISCRFIRSKVPSGFLEPLGLVFLTKLSSLFRYCGDSRTTAFRIDADSYSTIFQ